MFLNILTVFTLIVGIATQNSNTSDSKNISVFPCKNNSKIALNFNSDSRNNNEYYLEVNEDFIRPSTTIIFTFSDPVNFELKSEGNITVTSLSPNTVKLFYDTGDEKIIIVLVSGKYFNVIPFVTSIIINGSQECTEPISSFIDLVQKSDSLRLLLEASATTCGRRKLTHTELVTNSILTKPGDWPWHAAVYRNDFYNFEYKCGGTLLSRIIVLTAGHCLVERGVYKVIDTEKVIVYLGKYNLYKTDKDIQAREVKTIILHENYNAAIVNNDIGLLKLKSPVEYNYYVQPICLWNDDVLNILGGSNMYGTVVGWGFDENDHLATEIRQATFPMIDGLTCILSNTLFFGKYLNNFKFCAGYQNGTSACNGDSGGGFVVFVPDKNTANYNSQNSVLEGSWYIRGIVSLAVARREVSICNRNSYVLFTDVAKYTNWIKNHLNAEDTADSNVESNTTKDSYIERGTVSKEPGIRAPGSVSCGKSRYRRSQSSNSFNSNPGDWPWHAALYGISKGWTYICGGTLISKTVVVTAVRCIHDAMIPLNLTSYRIVLGKHNFKNIDSTLQIKKISEMIYPDTSSTYRLEDLALLKLDSEVLYGPYISSACLWNQDAEERAQKTLVYHSNMYGSVAGWRENGRRSENNNILTIHSMMPMFHDKVQCSRNNIYFRLDNNGFCTKLVESNCIVSNGAGFLVFIPDYPESYTEVSNAPGSWFLRGVGANSVAITNNSYCDTFNAMYFADIQNSSTWIREQLLRWMF